MSHTKNMSHLLHPLNLRGMRHVNIVSCRHAKLIRVLSSLHVSIISTCMWDVTKLVESRYIKRSLIDVRGSMYMYTNTDDTNTGVTYEYMLTS